MTKTEIKARAKALRDRKEGLEAALTAAPAAEGRAIRLELARIEEDLVDCARELRALTPRHKVSYRTTLASAGGRELVHAQYRMWKELESAGEPEELSGQELMRLAVRTVRKNARLTVKQAEYLDAAEEGTRGVQIAREKGLDKSTISRTLKRGRTKIDRDAKALYTILERQGELDGLVVIDLSDPAVLCALLDLLTVKQQTYLYLYYGEWLSLREIGALCGVDHASILRSIRAALERLDRLLLGSQAEVRGLDALEARLIAYFDRLEDQEPAKGTVQTKYKQKNTGRKQSEKADVPAEEPLTWTLEFVRGEEARTALLDQYLRPAFFPHWGSGCLLPMLRQRLLRQAKAGKIQQVRTWLSRKMRTALRQLFLLIRRDLHADNH